MKIRIRLIQHTLDEIIMGHSIFYTPLKTDALSVTANFSGFTTLHSIVRYFRYNDFEVKKYSDISNKNKTVTIYSEDNKPLLILVPKTNNEDDVVKFFGEIKEISVCYNIKTIEFTHLQMILSKGMICNARFITKVFCESITSIGCDTIYYDLDYDYVGRVFGDGLSAEVMGDDFINYI